MDNSMINNSGGFYSDNKKNNFNPKFDLERYYSLNQTYYSLKQTCMFG